MVGSSNKMEVVGMAATTVEDDVEGLKLEIQDVKAAILENRQSMSRTEDVEEIKALREERTHLYDEMKRIRDEVRLKLEGRNLLLQMQLLQQQQRLMDLSPPPPSISANKVAYMQRPETPWGYPDYASAGWQNFPMHQRRECEAGSDLPGWPIMQQPQTQPAQQNHQQQQQLGKSKLAPLLPKESPGTETYPVTETTTSNHRKRKRNSNSGAKEEQENHGPAERERVKRQRWRDHWVVQLIQVRGSMQEDFKKPPKQGMDLWRQVFNKVVSACPDFDKEPEACRKKWKTIVSEYKAASNVEGHDKEKRKWYQMIDEYFNKDSVADPVTASLSGGEGEEE